MKSVMNYDENAKVKPAYPYLGYQGVTQFVVLFTSEGKGVLVGANNSIGMFGTWPESDFKPYHGTVTLSND